MAEQSQNACYGYHDYLEKGNWIVVEHSAGLLIRLIWGRGQIDRPDQSFVSGPVSGIEYGPAKDW